MIIFPLSANSDLLTLLFAHISFRHRDILHFPALPLDHFPIGLQRHVWHCKGLNLLARIIWYRSKAKIDRTLHRHQVANTPPAQCSNSLPHEIVEMTIGDLIHDVWTLKACSLTCYSLYIAAFPYICAEFVTKGNPNTTGNFGQIEPIFISILQSRDSHHFFALTNIFSLPVQYLDIISLIPGVERDFEHLSLTLRSLTLDRPRCTPLQLSHLISFFPNLDDIVMRYFRAVPKPLTEDIYYSYGLGNREG